MTRNTRISAIEAQPLRFSAQEQTEFDPTAFGFDLETVASGFARPVQIVDPGDDQHYVCRLCDPDACDQTKCPVNLAYPDLYDDPAARCRSASN